MSILQKIINTFFFLMILWRWILHISLWILKKKLQHKHDKCRIIFLSGNIIFLLFYKSHWFAFCFLLYLFVYEYNNSGTSLCLCEMYDYVLLLVDSVYACTWNIHVLTVFVVLLYMIPAFYVHQLSNNRCMLSRGYIYVYLWL